MECATQCTTNKHKIENHLTLLAVYSGSSAKGSLFSLTPMRMHHAFSQTSKPPMSYFSTGLEHEVLEAWAAQGPIPLTKFVHQIKRLSILGPWLIMVWAIHYSIAQGHVWLMNNHIFGQGTGSRASSGINLSNFPSLPSRNWFKSWPVIELMLWRMSSEVISRLQRISFLPHGYWIQHWK